jgi:hypothetical protein
MNKRNETRREVLLDVGDEAIMSLDALVEQCHPRRERANHANAARGAAGARERVG